MKFAVWFRFLNRAYLREALHYSKASDGRDWPQAIRLRGRRWDFRKVVGKTTGKRMRADPLHRIPNQFRTKNRYE